MTGEEEFELRRCVAVVPQRAGSRPRWAELRRAAEDALKHMVAEHGMELVGQVRYVKRVSLTAFGALDPETLLVDKYIFEGQARPLPEEEP